MSTISSSSTGPEETPYFRKFTVAELGIDTPALLTQLQPVYDTLRWDAYDVIRGGLKKPTRKRGLAEFTLQKTADDWQVERVEAQPYQQDDDHGDYIRTEPRTYPEVIALQKRIADITHSVREDAKKLRMIFTFLRTVDAPDRSGICALEGTPHIDGIDYIVSALVINRQNLKPETGESSVYTMDQEPLMHTVLQPGEGIFQDDKNLMHHITNIQRDVQEEIGIRDMLGIDVSILSQ
ncbi:MAG: 2OG-Fe dioxygenase family protein [bacterium]|nr:2OG-Fe dioxygenase family protein [bacterium]